jgi:hypothetical protein
VRRAYGDAYVAPDDPSGPAHTFVRRPGDFPAAVAGVITLPNKSTWELVQDVDLAGARLQVGTDVVIKGQSSENCKLSSTGLIGTALISGSTSDIGVALNDAGTEGLDWVGVNFVGCTTAAGTITDYANCLVSDSIIVDSGPLTFLGTFDTVSFFQCLVSATAGNSGITVDAGATINRRFRMTDCAVVAGPPTSTGVTAAPGNFTNAESCILNDVNFTGSGTPLSGISSADNAALIQRCVGIPNSANITKYRMNANAVATTLTTAGVFYKVAGVTVSGAFVAKFTNTDNRATYTGALDAGFSMTAVLSFTGKANEATVTVPTGGRTENVSIIELESLITGDYVEVWVWLSNLDTSSETATVSDLHVIIGAI